MNRSELTKLLTFLGDTFSEGKFAFPRNTKGKTKRRVEAWGEFIGKYDYELVKDVVKRMIGEGRQWPPEVGEIKQRVKDKIKAQERRDNKPDPSIDQRKARMEIEEQQETNEWLKEEVEKLRERGKLLPEEEKNAKN